MHKRAVPFDPIRSISITEFYVLSFISTTTAQRKITWKVAVQFRSELQMRGGFQIGPCARINSLFPGAIHLYRGTKRIRSFAKIHFPLPTTSSFSRASSLLAITMRVLFDATRSAIDQRFDAASMNYDFTQGHRPAK